MNITIHASPSPHSGFKVIGTEGYDDGGVADLSLLIDLEDSVQRRKRGENEYFSALKADLLPRATRGPMAKMTRREQKVSLAQLLFSEDDDTEDKGPSEVYIEVDVSEEDGAVTKHRRDRLAQARAALRLSLLLREPACASLSLSELCKRKLTLSGKEGAEEALRWVEQERSELRAKRQEMKRSELYLIASCWASANASCCTASVNFSGVCELLQASR